MLPDNLPKRVLEYRREFLTRSPDTQKQGLKWLFDDLVDRHYYFSLRSEWNPESPHLKRQLWIHIPECHRPTWPSPAARSVRSLNEELAKDELAFPFRNAVFVHKVIKDLSETQTEPGQLKAKLSETVEEYNQQLKDIFEPGVCPADYPPNVYNFERNYFFNEFGSGIRWVFFPLCFRGVWVSILAARVSGKPEEMEQRLDQEIGRAHV